MKKKINIEIAKLLFEKNGCKLISKEYSASNKSLDYIAQCGHRASCTYNYFQQGHGRLCRKCSKEKISAAKSVGNDELKRFFSSEGCTLISDKNRSIDTVEYIARCGHRNKIKAFAFRQGEGRLCRECVKEKSRAKQTDVEATFGQFGCKLLSKYESAFKKVDYIARCGHKARIRVNDFKNGYGRICPKCAQKKYVCESIVFEACASMFKDAACQYVMTEDHIRYVFDVYVPSRKLAIEYNGLQHYEHVPFFHKDDNGMLVQIARDARKRKFCDKSGITLIVIDGRKFNTKNITEDLVRKEIERQLKGGESEWKK